MSRGSGCTGGSHERVTTGTDPFNTADKLAVEETSIIRLDAELAALHEADVDRKRDLAWRRQVAWVERQLFYAHANIAKLAKYPHVPPYHPEPSNPATMQELPFAAIDGVVVVLVTRGTNGRGTPRVQLNSPYARYASKLTAAEAREFGEGLLQGADALDSESPVPEPGTTGPQATTLSLVRDQVWADLIEKGADNRGKRRIMLKLRGARYAISIGAADARTIGQGLVEAAEALESAPLRADLHLA
jgi:hypothetical protein